MRILLERIGALGDCIIVTPLIHYLKELGNEVYFFTSAESGVDIVKNNPHIDKIIPYIRDTVPAEKLTELLESTRQAYECDKVIDMCESIEYALALHPLDPRYMLPKYDRATLCNKNYYDYSFEFAGYPEVKGRGQGELFFTDEEKLEMASFFYKYKKMFVLLWGLSGSGRNKTYPAVQAVQLDLLNKYPDLLIVTVGDYPCKLFEIDNHPRMIAKSGVWTIRQSMLACRYVNLVISPDTGLLHAAGCFSTPKVGLLGHSTIENITKYFENDYSIESECDCAPCFRLIYNAAVQCPICPITSGTYCMTAGLKAERVSKHIDGVIGEYYYGNRRKDIDREIIRPNFAGRARTRIAIA